MGYKSKELYPEGANMKHNHSYLYTGDDDDYCAGDCMGDWIFGVGGSIGVDEGSTNYDTGDAPSSWTTHTHSITGSTANNISSPSSMTNQAPSVTVFYLIKLY